MQEIGSGTTAVACAELGVPFIGYEIVEEYAEMANKRVKEHKR
nr:MAG: putative AdoMet-dependent methyltransferase [Bacteriophage sp.]UWI40445.1 MAG: putative AdoMet-dependent methyltransferase [Bacteriophage sp.]